MISEPVQLALPFRLPIPDLRHIPQVTDYGPGDEDDEDADEDAKNGVLCFSLNGSPFLIFDEPPPVETMPALLALWLREAAIQRAADPELRLARARLLPLLARRLARKPPLSS